MNRANSRVALTWLAAGALSAVSLIAPPSAAEELRIGFIAPKTGIFAQLGETLRLWRKRKLERRELARWSERDLHDVGLSWSDVVREAEKPFWRA